ncbi:MAG: hypothetical protein Q4F49_08125 [Pseudoxanthomonas suwonensis]|nr:hypothetical protein [Pseudoxanthomonas suwonensis]
MKTRNIVKMTVVLTALLAGGLAMAQQVRSENAPRPQETAAEREAREAKEAKERAKAREERQRERRERAQRGDDYEPEEDPRNIPAR